MTYILAIDIGGTKIAAGLFGKDQTLLHRHEVPTAADPTSTPTFNAAHNIVQRAFTAAQRVLVTHAPLGVGVAAIGISTGGDVDAANGRIAYATPLLPGWAGLDLRAKFQRELHVPVCVENDGNCAALAEAMSGAAQGCSHALTIIVGTGIGAGYVVHGQLLQGAAGGALNPGQMFWGETPYENEIASGALAQHYGMPIAQLAQAFLDGTVAEEKIVQAAHGLGKLAAQCAAILDPNCIVIAGSILLLGEPFLRRAQAAFVRYARPPHQKMLLRQSTLGANAALLGAAWLAEEYSKRAPAARPMP
jgi:glucokinase